MSGDHAPTEGRAPMTMVWPMSFMVFTKPLSLERVRERSERNGQRSYKGETRVDNPEYRLKLAFKQSVSGVSS